MRTGELGKIYDGRKRGGEGGGLPGFAIVDAFPRRPSCPRADSAEERRRRSCRTKKYSIQESWSSVVRWATPSVGLCLRAFRFCISHIPTPSARFLFIPAAALSSLATSRVDDGAAPPPVLLLLSTESLWRPPPPVRASRCPGTSCAGWRPGP